MMDLYWKAAVVVVVSYFLGNLNGAILVSERVNKEDVRHKGSGNAGVTNYVRSFGLRSAVPVLLIDLLKAVAACILGRWLLGTEGYGLEGAALGGLAASLGHDFPVFFGFKGGKGIICGAALALCLDWRIFLIDFSLFLLVYFATHYVSLGSMLVSALLPVLLFLFYPDRPVAVVLVALAAVLAVFQHRGNLIRLCKGNESKMYLKKKKEG